MEVIRLVPEERMHERIVEETIDVPVSRVMEETIEELVTTRDTNKLLNDCELIPKWLNVVKGVVGSEDPLLNVCHENLLQNKILRVTKKNHVTKCLDMLAKLPKRTTTIARSSTNSSASACLFGIHEAELLRFNTSKPGDEQISLKEYVDRMKEGQTDNCYITGESIAVVSSLFEENLRKKDHEVPYMSDPVDECAVHQFKEFGGKMLKSTTKERSDLGDEDEKKTLEELNTELKPLTKLMKHILADKVERAMVSDRIVDSPCVLTTSEYGWSAKMERIMEAQALRDNSMISHMVSEKTMEVNPAAWEQQHKSSKQATTNGKAIHTTGEGERKGTKGTGEERSRRKGVCEKGSERNRAGREREGGRKGR